MKIGYLFVLKVFFLFCFFSLLGIFLPVRADEYEVQMEFDINILENRSALVTQYLSITNSSPDFLTSSFSIDFPFEKVEALKVEMDGEPIPGNIESKRLWVEFNGDAISTNENKKFILKYTLPNFVEVLGDVHMIVWPDFRIEENDARYPVRISYPIEWEDTLYSSQGVDSNLAFDTNRAISFTEVDSKLSIFVGRESLKEVSVNLDPNKVNFAGGDLLIPIRENIFLSRIDENVKISTIEDEVNIRIGLRNFPRSKNLVFYTKDIKSFDKDLSLGKYAQNTAEEWKVNTTNPRKIYEHIMKTLTPTGFVEEWRRKTVNDIFAGSEHTDLDYASAFVFALRANNIPAHIVYGIARYPDNSYLWHSWVVYGTETGGETVWSEADPFLGDLTGDNYMEVPPDRIMWGVIAYDSDLRDISRDLFLLKPESIRLRQFDSALIESGYLMGQTNKLVPDSSFVQSEVLGESTYRQSTNKYVFPTISVFAFTVFLIITYRALKIKPLPNYLKGRKG